MVRYGLAKSVNRCKSSSNTKKTANGFENVFLQGFVSHSEKFKVNFVVVVT